MSIVYNVFTDNLDYKGTGGGGSGNVVGPASATDGDFAQFDGTTGKLLKDGGYNPDSFVRTINGTGTPVSGNIGMQATYNNAFLDLLQVSPFLIVSSPGNENPTFPLPGNYVNLFDDFIDNGASTGNGQLVWSNSGANLAYTTPPDANHPGISTFTVPNPTNGLYLSDNSNFTNSFIPGATTTGSIFTTQVMNLVTLSTILNRYTMIVGMTDNSQISTPSAAPTNGAFFSYSDNVNGGNWQANVVIGGAPTTTDTGIAGDTSYHRFDINIGTDACYFLIDGVTVGVLGGITTALTPCFWAFASLGNSPAFSVDMFNLIQIVTR